MLYNKLFSGLWMNVSYAYALRGVFYYISGAFGTPHFRQMFSAEGERGLHPNSAKKKQVFLVENTFFDLLHFFLGSKW